MGLREVRKELQELSKEELIYHISEVYKRYKPVKEYFDFFANPDEEEIIDKVKAQIYEGFFPKTGKKLKLYRSRRALNAYRKLGVSAEADADLMLYYVEVSVLCAREKKVNQESYYTRLENGFEKALEYMQKHLLLDEFKIRIDTLVERAEELPFGCGVHLYSIRKLYQR